MKASPMVPSLASLPGASHWKNLALAGIQASNRCDRAPMKAFWSNMDAKDRDVVVKAAKGSISTMADLEAGQTGPMGFFDPAGISSDLDEGKILFYREAELKHGRVCMLASLGFLVGENFHPLFGNLDGPSVNWLLQRDDLDTFWKLAGIAVLLPELLSSTAIPGGVSTAFGNRYS